MAKDKKTATGVSNFDNSPQEEPKKSPTHRYFCDACTGIAFYHVLGEPLPNQATCLECGKVLTDLKETNLIAL